MLTRKKYDTLKALLTGKYIQFSISDPKSDELVKAGGLASPHRVVPEFEEQGIIVGYVPVLSEKGKKLMDAHALIFEDEDSDAGNGLIENMEP